MHSSTHGHLCPGRKVTTILPFCQEKTKAAVISKSSLKVCARVPLFSPHPLAEIVAFYQCRSFLRTPCPLHTAWETPEVHLGVPSSPFTGGHTLVSLASGRLLILPQHLTYGRGLARSRSAPFPAEVLQLVCEGGSARNTLHGGSHPGSALLHVVPRSSPRALITEEVLAKLWSFIQTQTPLLSFPSTPLPGGVSWGGGTSRGTGSCRMESNSVPRLEMQPSTPGGFMRKKLRGYF